MRLPLGKAEVLCRTGGLQDGLPKHQQPGAGGGGQRGCRHPPCTPVSTPRAIAGPPAAAVCSRAQSRGRQLRAGTLRNAAEPIFYISCASLPPSSPACFPQTVPRGDCQATAVGLPMPWEADPKISTGDGHRHPPAPPRHGAPRAVPALRRARQPHSPNMLLHNKTRAK